MIETFPRDSIFIKNDTRTKRWAVPYHYEALNSRVENLIIKNKFTIEKKDILDLGCHFGTFAYACLLNGANTIHGVDSESSLIKKADDMFSSYNIPLRKYKFYEDDVISYLANCAPNSYDTVLCLGIFYYLNDPYNFLNEMLRVARKYILLDTFTAYYGACVAKDGKDIARFTIPETFELPLVIHLLTQSRKKDYFLKNNFTIRNNRKLSMLALPTIPALENFFRLLNVDFTFISWEDYILNKNFWTDFIDQDTKLNSHWADIYQTKIRVSYLLTKK